MYEDTLSRHWCDYDVETSPPTSEWEIPNFDELDPFNPFTRFSILLISLALGLEARTAEVVFSIWLFWWFIAGEGDLDDTFFTTSAELLSWKGATRLGARFDDTLVVVFVDATERFEVDEGGGEFDKADVEDVDEFLGIIEWNADPLFTVVTGVEIGCELGGFGEDAGEPVDPTLGGGGGNE